MRRAYGTHRTVYLVRKLAIKVPVVSDWRMFLTGLLANMQEARFSATGGGPNFVRLYLRVPAVGSS